MYVVKFKKLILLLKIILRIDYLLGFVLKEMLLNLVTHKDLSGIHNGVATHSLRTTDLNNINYQKNESCFILLLTRNVRRIQKFDI